MGGVSSHEDARKAVQTTRRPDGRQSLGITIVRSSDGNNEGKDRPKVKP